MRVRSGTSEDPPVMTSCVQQGEQLMAVLVLKHGGFHFITGFMLLLVCVPELLLLYKTILLHFKFETD